MKVNQAMTRNVMLLAPEQTLRDAARMMADGDLGAIPVAQGDRLVGMLTDRDITVRAVAQGLSPETRVVDVMSHEVLYCFDDENLSDVSINMGQVQVRRLPVVNRQKRLVGILSIGDIASCEDVSQTGHAIAGISAPGGAHSQSLH